MSVVQRCGLLLELMRHSLDNQCVCLLVKKLIARPVRTCRPCPADPYPGPNAIIPFPCPGSFRFPVQGDFGHEEYLGTAKLPLKETLAKTVASIYMAQAEASIPSTKCKDALAVMLPCEDQLID